MEKLKTEYWSKLSTESDDWKKGFPAVFGITVEQFYADFEAHFRTR